ncbi:MAG: NAD-dependent epimerase/dehydratase family protein [Bacteroidetes bacterium]|jgi:dihydroflavonol-4-reductase|nr:NAD-dependent epimerase/dehydratase family protein [Bacteroidota bacterium]MDF1863808.1 NAD-dependent epimerase/dehydratase family protein [Saprospiraceae bacterium]
MKILVTGANGMLGTNLIKELITRRKEIVAFDITANRSSIIDQCSIEFIQGSILKEKDIKRAIKGCEVVIHIAALVKTWPSRSSDFKDINVRGTQKLLKAALKEGVKKIIYVGSSSSFDFGDRKHPGTEKKPFGGYHYGLDYIDSKYHAQTIVLDMVKNTEIEGLVINPTFMIGPYDSGPGSGQLILSFNEGDLKFMPPGGKNFVDVRDVANAIANAIELGTTGECYIAGHENLTYSEFFGKASKALGRKPYGITLSGFLIKSVGALSSLIAPLFGKKPLLSYPVAKISCDKQYFSPEKAVKELNMPQTPIEIAIKDAMDWFNEHGYCKKCEQPKAVKVKKERILESI